MLSYLEIVKARLKEHDYKRIQFLPFRRSLAVGKEFYVFKSFFYQNAPSLFHSSFLYSLYHFIFRKRNPYLYRLYKTFFMDEATDRESLLEIFNAKEIDDFIKNGILRCEGHYYKFNYRFIPFEDLFLVAKVNTKDPGYAHLNYDSITFVELLRKMQLRQNYQRALEIGCGAGLISLEIARSSRRVDAVDLNPYAVVIMEMNAQLNKIPNITTFTSNCYNKIKERYDLIVSDPPFELMPDEAKNILHRYGGFLGMETASRIFSGIDNYLSDNGEAVVFTNSYIINFKENSLVKKLYAIFKDKKFKITLYALSYQINPEFYSLYRRFNISHSVSYFIHFQRANGFEIVIVPLKFLSKIKEIIRVFYLYALVLFKARDR